MDTLHFAYQVSSSAKQLNQNECTSLDEQENKNKSQGRWVWEEDPEKGSS